MKEECFDKEKNFRVLNVELQVHNFPIFEGHERGIISERKEL